MIRTHRMLAWVLALVLALTAGGVTALAESAQPKYTTEIEVDKDAVVVKEGKSAKVTVRLWAIGDADTLRCGILNEEGKKDEIHTSYTITKYKMKVVITIKGVAFGQVRLVLRSGQAEEVSVPITVAPPKPLPAETVTLDVHEMTLEKGKAFKLTAEVGPMFASPKVTWSSSAKKIASVNSKGKVTAKKPGTAIITVKTRSKITDVCVVTVLPKGGTPTPTPEPTSEPTPEPTPETTPAP